MKRYLCLIPVLLIACLIPGAAARAQEVFFRPALQARDIEPTLRTDWYGVYHKDKKIGYFKSRRARGADTIIESTSWSMKLVSAGEKTEIKGVQLMVFENKTPYRFLQGALEETDGATTTKILARRLDKGFEYTHDAAGNKRTKRVDDPDYTLADSMALEVWLAAGPKVGAQISTRDLSLEEWTNDPSTNKLKSVKTSFVRGVAVKYYEVEQESRKEKLTTLSLHGADGNLISGKIASMFDVRLESEKDAKNTEFSRDIFVLGMAKIDRPIGPAEKLTELAFEVSGKQAEAFENSLRQTVVRKSGDTRLVKVGKMHANDIRPTAKEIAENLAETNAYAIADPKVKALAAKVVGNARTPEEKVRRIVAFVHSYLKPSLDIALPNIHDLMEKKRGDCRCCSLMVANLCRADGVPARETFGLLYMGDDEKAFGGHAWNEVVLNGVWIPVDATLNQVEVDAGHISLDIHRNNRESDKSLTNFATPFKLVASQTSK